MGSNEKISLFALDLLAGSPRSGRCQCTVCLVVDVFVLVSALNDTVGQFFSPDQNPGGE